MKRLLIPLLLVVLVTDSFGLSKVGTTAAPFLGISPGARAQAMGSAFTGVADDVTAMYYNPAGISRLGQTETSFIRQNWIADMNYYWFGYAWNATRNSSLGVSMTMLDMGEMPVTTIVEPLGTGENFLSYSLAMGVAYAVNFTDRFSIGFQGKYVEETIWHEHARSVAMDIGTLFRTPFRDMKIGMSILNVGGDMSMTGQDLLVPVDMDDSQTGDNSYIPSELHTASWPLPLQFRVGLAQDIRLDRVNRITWAVDALHPIDNEESINVGLEYAFSESFFVRGGQHNLFLPHWEGGTTLGGGIRVALPAGIQMQVDYVWEDMGMRLADAHKFAVLFSWK